MMQYGFMPAYGTADFIVRQLIEKHSAAFADLDIATRDVVSGTMRKPTNTPKYLHDYR